VDEIERAQKRIVTSKAQVALGTDCGMFPFSHGILEFQAMVAAGLTTIPSSVICCPGIAAPARRGCSVSFRAAPAAKGSAATPNHTPCGKPKEGSSPNARNAAATITPKT
jgi:hypothetical protein